MKQVIMYLKRCDLIIWRDLEEEGLYACESNDFADI